MTRGACRGISVLGGGEKIGLNVSSLTTFEAPFEDRFRRCVLGASVIPFRDGKVGELAHTAGREQIGRREAVDRGRRGEKPAAHFVVACKDVPKDGDSEAELAERISIVEGDRLSRGLDNHVQHVGNVAQRQGTRMAITQPLLQLVPIHRTSPRCYSAVDPRDNQPTRRDSGVTSKFGIYSGIGKVGQTNEATRSGCGIFPVHDTRCRCSFPFRVNASATMMRS